MPVSLQFHLEGDGTGTQVSAYAYMNMHDCM